MPATSPKGALVCLALGRDVRSKGQLTEWGSGIKRVGIGETGLRSEAHRVLKL